MLHSQYSFQIIINVLGLLIIGAMVQVHGMPQGYYYPVPAQPLEYQPPQYQLPQYQIQQQYLAPQPPPTYTPAPQPQYQPPAPPVTPAPIDPCVLKSACG